MCVVLIPREQEQKQEQEQESKAGTSPSGCMHRSTRRTIEQTDRAELPLSFLGVAVSPPVGSHVWRMRCG